VAASEANGSVLKQHAGMGNRGLCDCSPKLEFSWIFLVLEMREARVVLFDCEATL
jgi:hypothetical protein